MDAMVKAVEGISGEISSLKEHRHAAQAEAERAAEILKRLSERKAALTSNALSAERGVGEKLAIVMGNLTEALNEEAQALSRTKARAEEAIQELDRLILETEVEYNEAQKNLARKRYNKLSEERYALDGKAEDAVAVLVEVLEQLERMYAEQVRVAAEAENASLAYQDPRETLESWLARRLRRWLSLASFDRYDAPLPELDPLAQRSKPKGESQGVGD